MFSLIFELKLFQIMCIYLIFVQYFPNQRRNYAGFVYWIKFANRQYSDFFFTDKVIFFLIFAHACMYVFSLFIVDKKELY